MSHPFVGQSIQGQLKGGRNSIALLKRSSQAVQSHRKLDAFRIVRDPDSGDRVKQRFAFRASDGLHKTIQAAIRFSRNLRPITTFAAFKPVCPAHRPGTQRCTFFSAKSSQRCAGAINWSAVPSIPAVGTDRPRQSDFERHRLYPKHSTAKLRALVHPGGNRRLLL